MLLKLKNLKTQKAGSHLFTHPVDLFGALAENGDVLSTIHPAHQQRRRVDPGDAGDIEVTVFGRQGRARI